jgi:hypothetical protein
VLHINANLFMPSLINVTERHYATILERRATAAILAIRLYAIDHDGKLPERLEDLAPQYLTKIPADPFTRNGNPIKYQLGTNPILYGVNKNGIDDGGSTLDQRGKPSQSPWNALDMVFHLTRQPRPVEETPEPDMLPYDVEPEVTDDAAETEATPATPEPAPQ